MAQMKKAVIKYICKAKMVIWLTKNAYWEGLLCKEPLKILWSCFFLLSAVSVCRWLYGRTVCVIYAFCGVLFGICSLTTLTILSTVCCLKVCYPLHGTQHYICYYVKYSPKVHKWKCFYLEFPEWITIGLVERVIQWLPHINSHLFCSCMIGTKQ